MHVGTCIGKWDNFQEVQLNNESEALSDNNTVVYNTIYTVIFWFFIYLAEMIFCLDNYKVNISISPMLHQSHYKVWEFTLARLWLANAVSFVDPVALYGSKTWTRINFGNDHAVFLMEPFLLLSQCFTCFPQTISAFLYNYPFHAHVRENIHIYLNKYSYVITVHTSILFSNYWDYVLGFECILWLKASRVGYW